MLVNTPVWESAAMAATFLGAGRVCRWLCLGFELWRIAGCRCEIVSCSWPSFLEIDSPPDHNDLLPAQPLRLELPPCE